MPTKSGSPALRKTRGARAGLRDNPSRGAAAPDFTSNSSAALPRDLVTTTGRRVRMKGECPVCRGPNDLVIDWKPGRGGDWTWLYLCEECGSAGHLRRLMEASGRPGSEWLEGLVPVRGLRVVASGSNPSRARGGQPTLPSAGTVRRWHEALFRDGPALDYLRDQRGLSLETVARAQIGYARDGALRPYGERSTFTMPVFDRRGRLVNVRRRFWPEVPTDRDGKPIKYAGVPDAGAQLYPRPPGKGPFVVVCEGEFDALLLDQEFRAAGIRARVVTTTCGMEWPSYLARYARGRRFAVIYDADKYAKAAARADALLARGARDAFAVDLRRGGLRGKEDLTDWFVTHGRSADELRALIREARRNANPDRAATRGAANAKR
jgi:hypothetical protein